MKKNKFIEEPDIFVIKLNSNGNIVWRRIFGGSGWEGGYSIKITSDGGYILTGYTSSNDGDFNEMNKGEEDIFVVKLNSNGDIVWKKVFGGSGDDRGYSIVSTSDGGYILTGNTESNNGDFRGMNNDTGNNFVIKLNSNGDIILKYSSGCFWDKVEGSIISTDDGVCVNTYSNNSDFYGMNQGIDDIFIIKIGHRGEVLWTRIYGGSRLEEEESMVPTSDGGCIITGYTTSNDGDFSGMNKGGEDIFVIKLDKNGNLNKK
jgi:hypothetical protein